MQEASSDHQRRERIILFILAAVQFTTIVDFMIVMPLGPQLMETLKIGTADFSIIVSSYTFAAGLSGLLAATIVDRFDRRTAFLVMYSGFLIGTLFCGLAPNYLTLVLARIATGFFGGILGGMSMTIVGDVFPESQRGRATGSLMSGFAFASVAGVPMGLMLGTRYGWHVPFVALVLLGLPVLFLTPLALPRLTGHLQHKHGHPLKSLWENFTIPAHLNAFALTTALMLGSFTVFPFVAAYFMGNVGMTDVQLPIMYVVGGALTLVAAPLVGKAADKYGKLRVYRIIAPISALLLLAITTLPKVHVAVAVVVFGSLMVTNVGRMIAAMSMITSSVEPRRRGGFLSANSSIQHLASGIAASLGGLIVEQGENQRLEHFGYVGVIACCTTLVTLWLAGRVGMFEKTPVSAEAISLAAAAEASMDDAEPMIVAVPDHG